MDEMRLRCAALLKALGHPTRLHVIELLATGEHCVCEMMPVLGTEQSTLSKHLAILRNEGVVTCRREGLKVIYRLCGRHYPEIYRLTRLALIERWSDEDRLVYALKEGTTDPVGGRKDERV